MTFRTHAVRSAAVMLLGIISCGRGGHLFGPDILRLEPATVALAPGKSQQFVAIGTNAHPVWSVGSAENGIISASGLYEAPFNLPLERNMTLHADPGGRTAEITLLDLAPDPRDCCGDTQDQLPARGDTLIVDAAPEALIKVPPVYPDIARESGVEGTVHVGVLVCRNGLVYATAIAPGRSIPMLDDAAVAAVRKWLFKPARAGGRSVAVWITIPIRFTLH